MGLTKISHYTVIILETCYRREQKYIYSVRMKILKIVVKIPVVCLPQISLSLPCLAPHTAPFFRTVRPRVAIQRTQAAPHLQTHAQNPAMTQAQKTCSHLNGCSDIFIYTRRILEMFRNIRNTGYLSPKWCKDKGNKQYGNLRWSQPTSTYIEYSKNNVNSSHFFEPPRD